MNNSFQNNNQNGYQHTNQYYQNVNQQYPYVNAPQKPKKNGAMIALIILAVAAALLIGIGLGGFAVYKFVSTTKGLQAATPSGQDQDIVAASEQDTGATPSGQTAGLEGPYEETDGPTSYFTAEKVTDTEDRPYIEPDPAMADDGGLTFDSVDWDDPETDYPGQEKHYELTFHLSDGSTRTTYLDTPSIEDVDYADFDNDGKDELVMCCYFANTGGEFFEKYIYKIKDDEVVLIFPNSDIYELTDTPINADIITVTVDGKERYGLETVTLGKDNGESYIQYHAKIYYNVDHWEVAEMINDEE